MSITPTPTASPRLRGDRRLTSRADYLRVQRTGVRVHTKHFVVLAARGLGPLPSPSVGALPARMGTAISRKAGNAVKRNRIRRLLREVFRSMDPEGSVFDIDFVVVGGERTKQLERPTLRSIEEEVRPAIQRAKELVDRSRARVARGDG